MPVNAPVLISVTRAGTRSRMLSLLAVLVTLLAGTAVAADSARDVDTSLDSARAEGKVRLRVPSIVSSTMPTTAKVVVRLARKSGAGRVVVRDRSRTVYRARVTGGRRHKVAVTLPAMKPGTHRLRAIYRGRSPRVRVKSPVVTVESVAGCAPQPSICGYPDASNTGPVAGVSLRTINDHVDLRVDGAVFENAIVHGHINIHAANVTVRNVSVINSGEDWGIGLQHSVNATVENVEITSDGTRLAVGVKDVHGDAVGTTVRRSEITRTSTGIQTHEGLVEDNYIHDMGFVEGDHINGFTSNGSTEPLTIDHNTILVQYDQTDAISLFQDFGLEANRQVTDNLLAGGSYTLYAGGGNYGTSHDITIVGNRFSRIFFPRGGTFGPVSAWDAEGSGNTWSNNIWDDSGATIPEPR